MENTISAMCNKVVSFDRMVSEMRFGFRISTVNGYSGVKQYIRENGNSFCLDEVGNKMSLLAPEKIKEENINSESIVTLLTFDLGVMGELLEKIHEKQKKLIENEILIQRYSVVKQQEEILKELINMRLKKTKDLIKKIYCGGVDLGITSDPEFRLKVQNANNTQSIINVVREYISRYFNKNQHIFETRYHVIAREYSSSEEEKKLITKDSESVLEKILENKDFQTLSEQGVNLEKLIGFVGRETYKDLSRRANQKDNFSQTDFELLDVYEAMLYNDIER